MSLHHNPRIVTDGLVFAYDMNNAAKSFKGKPTTNLFDNPVFATGTRAPWSYQTTANGDNSIDTSFTYEGFNTAKIVRTSTGGEANYWVNSSSVVSGDINPNTEYTFSAYAYATVANQAALFSYFGTQSSGFAYHPGGGKWVRLAHTFTSRSTSPYVQLRMWSDTITLNTPVYFTKLQLEEGSFATPWVNGTRSNTQALLDMSKSKNTVTASSLTYNSDGTFEFDGTSDYISVSNSSSLNPSINTLICWAKSNTSTWNGTGFLMSKRNVFVMHPNGGAKSVSYYYHLNNSWQAQFITSSDITVWNMYACSWDGTNINAYLNGELINSGTKTGPLNTSDTGPIEIGRDDGIATRVFNGHIPFSLIYNRALTAAEIKQNFNATRGRFGI